MTILFLDYIFNRMQNVRNKGNDNRGKLATAKEKSTMSIGTSRRTSSSSSSNSGSKMGKRPGKRPGRKPSKIDEHAKLERSRQSARECRARKKLRYQYLEELVLNREKAVFALRDELETYQTWCSEVDEGVLPEDLEKKVVAEDAETTAMLGSSPEVSGDICSSSQIVDFTSTFDCQEEEGDT